MEREATRREENRTKNKKRRMRKIDIQKVQELALRVVSLRMDPTCLAQKEHNALRSPLVYLRSRASYRVARYVMDGSEGGPVLRAGESRRRAREGVYMLTIAGESQCLINC